MLLGFTIHILRVSLYTTEKNITNTLTLVPVGMHVGFKGPRHVLLY